MKYRIATLLSLAAALAMVVPSPLQGRDRPGTPNDVVAFTREYLDKKPTVAFKFRNTASEEVNFWVDWTVNGQQHSNEEFWAATRCGGGYLPGYADYFTCTGFMMPAQGWTGDAPSKFNETYTHSDESMHEHIKIAVILEAEWNTRYCFRVKARKKDGGIVSQDWSAWTCTNTPAAPPKPPAPVTPDVSFHQADDMHGRSGAPVPAHALIKWYPLNERPSGVQLVAYYIVQEKRENTNWHGAPGVPDHLTPGTGEYTINFGTTPPTFTDGITYRVCAGNISGWSCSQPNRLFPFDPKTARPTGPIMLPPVIMQPFNGQSLPASAGVLRIKAIYTPDAVAEIELTNITGKSVKTYQVPLAQIEGAGTPLTQLVPSGGGQFQARVHLVRPRSGPWSEPVTFNIPEPPRRLITKP